jgi:hypothetical protein
MANETSSANTSQRLHEVLESEFIALHGELPADYPTAGTEKEWLRAIWSGIHALKEKRAALCISGGGIRSATFGLGILQGLARCGLLDKFHYLSTVSGGGYIGSWLSAWIKNEKGVSGVLEQLQRRPESGLDPEPQPIRYLRAFSNYLAPRTGLTSMDFWTLITTFIRNMFLNWLVLISWLAAAMMIPRLYLAAVMVSPNWAAATDEVQTIQLIQWWNFPLNALLAVGFGLIASDGLCDYRCPFHWQRAITATAFPGIPSASVSARGSHFGGMVGCVPQRSWQRTVSSHGVVAQIRGFFRRELLDRRRSRGGGSFIS